MDKIIKQIKNETNKRNYIQVLKVNNKINKHKFNNKTHLLDYVEIDKKLIIIRMGDIEELTNNGKERILDLVRYCFGNGIQVAISEASNEIQVAISFIESILFFLDFERALEYGYALTFSENVKRNQLKPLIQSESV
jgi:hypothetical protein